MCRESKSLIFKPPHKLAKSAQRALAFWALKIFFQFFGIFIWGYAF